MKKEISGHKVALDVIRTDSLCELFDGLVGPHDFFGSQQLTRRKLWLGTLGEFYVDLDRPLGCFVGECDDSIVSVSVGHSSRISKGVPQYMDHGLGAKQRSRRLTR